jgi:hypothetical protein
VRRLLPLLILACTNPSSYDAASDGGKPDAEDASTAHAASDVVEAGPVDEAMPPATSAELTTRGRHLLEAIAQDNPDLAADVLFPRDAWSSSRDGQDPTKQWDEKIKPAFVSSVHYWNKHTKDVGRAQFVSFEIGKTVQQLSPKKKEWKKPLWQVKHGKLTFLIDGQTKHIDVLEMVSWRGAWYVTHLR